MYMYNCIYIGESGTTLYQRLLKGNDWKWVQILQTICHPLPVHMFFWAWYRNVECHNKEWDDLVV